MIRQSTATGRTFCTSSIQREVIQAHGHSGSNQNCTSSRDCDCSVMPAATTAHVSVFLASQRAQRASRPNHEAGAETAARVGRNLPNAPYGNRLGPADARLTARQDELAVENLILASQAAAKAGATVLIEPINSVDLPRYPIDTP